MKKLLLTLLLAYVSTSFALHPRLAGLKIYQDSPSLDKVGYGNCDSNTNGEHNLIRHALRSGDLVFDLGAHIGDWSKLILNTNSAVKIHVFEPIPASFRTLQERLNVPNVSLHNVAVTDAIGFQDFLIYLGNSGLTNCSSLYYRPVIAHCITEKIKVRTLNLDSFCKDNSIDHIDFLKIDTEGAEWSIFLGAQELLNAKAITLIQFEYGGCNIDSKTTLQQTYEMLTSKGYSLFRIVRDGLIQINNWRAELETFEYSNYIAVLNS